MSTTPTLKKTEVPGLYKVTEGVLINKDENALAAYKARKAKDKKIELMDRELTSMKSELSEIKSLLMELVNKK